MLVTSNCCVPLRTCSFFFFNDTATTEIYTLSLHDALPILRQALESLARRQPDFAFDGGLPTDAALVARSEEHTAELQSRLHIVCRLLLEKKKNSEEWPSLVKPSPLARRASVSCIAGWSARV